MIESSPAAIGLFAFLLASVALSDEPPSPDRLDPGCHVQSKWFVSFEEWMRHPTDYGVVSLRTRPCEWVPLPTSALDQSNAHEVAPGTFFTRGRIYQKDQLTGVLRMLVVRGYNNRISEVISAEARADHVLRQPFESNHKDQVVDFVVRLGISHGRGYYGTGTIRVDGNVSCIARDVKPDYQVDIDTVANRVIEAFRDEHVDQ